MFLKWSSPLVAAVALYAATSQALPTNCMMEPPSAWQLTDRDVGTLTCTPVRTGVLGYTQGSSSGHVSIIGQKNSIGEDVLHTLKSNGKDVTAHEFVFSACTSDKSPSFIGSPNNKDIQIGHISPKGDLDQCLSVNGLATTGIEIVLVDCSPSDDSSQLFQTFTLPPGDVVHFLGHQYGAGEDRVTDIRYQLSKSSKKYGAVLVNEVGKGGYASDRLQLKFI